MTTNDWEEYIMYPLTDLIPEVELSNIRENAMDGQSPDLSRT